MESRLLDAAAHRVIVLDAAIGTRLVARGLDLTADDPALWNLDHSRVVRDLHAADVAAGSDALLTNSFGANRHWMARFGRSEEVDPLNVMAVRNALEAAGPDRFLIGSIGPTAAGNPEACREQAQALALAGVDALAFETCRLDEARNALRAVGSECGRPLIVSLFEWPEPIAEAVRALEDLGASVLGANCQVGMGPMLGFARRVRPVTDLPLWVKPSADRGATPESFAAAVPELISLGVRLLGGCCGTTEAHVRALRAAVDSYG